ncbi:TRAP transporter small permease [Pelagicoccus mobilis]|uniref:TRAP transporter small permease n=1 Tax=Pelagicoccus mobilis TaxID=415221 RepID=A0A934RYS6_9BACT|nr:TRAP transporter small permease [Pelagicoccus mobilis]MBK1876324.1 TRAP transporter small permease [Pelagicoccus mobilis]
MSASENQILSAAVSVRRGLTRILQWVVIVLMAVLVLDVIWGVISRYAFGQQAKWSEELARLLLVWVSLFGASVAFSMKAHLGLDYFAEKLHPDAKKLNAILGAGIALAFAIIVFLIGGWTLMQKTLASGQQMVALPFPMWVKYAALPLSGVFMVVFLLEQLLERCFEPAVSSDEEGGFRA